MREKLVNLVVAGSAVSAFTVLLGRLWTASYFEYFGLPVADLTLDVQDYAFRTKEILLMLVLAGALLAGIGWRGEALGISGDGVAGWTPYRVFWAGAFGAVAVYLVVFSALAIGGSAVLEDTWRWLTVGLGVALGVGGGLVVAFARLHPRPWAWIAASGVAVLFVLIVPFAMVGLARAAAAHDVRSQNLAHAVLQFEERAPAPIRRADDETRSTRVYVVLSTPERLAVAFPYPCTQVGTAGERAGGSGGGTADLCDVLTFDRRLVRAIELVGKGGRPSNDVPERPEVVTLTTGTIGEDDLAPRVAYEQGFDFAAAASSRLDCRDGGDKAKGFHGVWLRLEARQSGRVEVVRPEPPGAGDPQPGAADRELAYFLVDAEDRRVCRRLGGSEAVHLDANATADLFVGMHKVDHDDTRQTIVLRFSPLAALATDCRLARPPGQTKATVACARGSEGGLGIRLRVPAGAGLGVDVEVRRPGFAPTPDNACPAGAALPRVFAAGAAMTVLGCRASAVAQDAVTVTFGGFTQGGAEASLDLVACEAPGAPDGSGALLSVRAALSPAVVPVAPAPEPGPESGVPAPAGAPSETAPVALTC